MTADALSRVLARGIGERNAEGFGDIAINAKLVSESTQNLQVQKETSAANVAQPDGLIDATTPLGDVGRRIEIAAWRKSLQTVAAEISTSDWISQQLHWNGQPGNRVS